MVDDSQDATARTTTVSGTQLTGLAPATIGFTAADLGSLTVNGGSGGNTFTVTDTPASIATTLNTFGGNNTFDVQGTGSGSTLTVFTGIGGTSTITLGGVANVGAQDLLGTITVISPPILLNNLTITVDDSGDAAARTATLGFGQITGLAPATINYGGGPFTQPSLTVDGGSGANTFTDTGTSSSITTINAGVGGNDTVNISGTGPVGTTNVNMQGGSNNSVDLGNQAAILRNVNITTGVGGTTALTIDDSNGSNSVTVGVTSTAVAFTGGSTVNYGGAVLTDLNINGPNTGSNVFNVTGTPATTNPTAISLFTGTGNTVNLGDPTHAASGLGSVSIGTGGSGAIALTIDDSADSIDQTVSVTSTAVGFGGGSNFDYTNAVLSGLVFDGGSGGNTITVSATPASITTTLDSGSGVDTVDVQGTGSLGTLNVNTQGGSNNTVTLGGVAGVGAGNLIEPINVASTGGTVDLTVDDSQGTIGRTATITGTQIYGLISFIPDQLASLTIDGSSGGNTVTVTNTVADITTTLNMGSGVDTLNVQGTGAGGLLNIDTQGGSNNIVTLGGLAGVGVQDLLGPINVASTGGTVDLLADDSGDATTRTATIGGTQITGLAPVTIGFTPGELSNLTVNGGSGGNVVNVNATPAGVATTINNGSGNDQTNVTVANLAASPASLVVNGETGSNTLTANAQTTTANSSAAGQLSFGTGRSLTYQNEQTVNVNPINQTPSLVAVPPLSATPGTALNNVIVGTFTEQNLVETAGGFAATINWGDGTATDAGTIVAVNGTPGTFDILGSHTYVNSGMNDISVSLADNGGSFHSTAGTSAIVTTIPAIANPVIGAGAQISVQAAPVPPPPPTPPTPTPPAPEA